MSRKSVTTDNSCSATETGPYVHRVLRSNYLHHHLPPYCSHCQHAQLPDMLNVLVRLLRRKDATFLTHAKSQINAVNILRTMKKTARWHKEGKETLAPQVHHA